MIEQKTVAKGHIIACRVVFGRVLHHLLRRTRLDGVLGTSVTRKLPKISFENDEVRQRVHDGRFEVGRRAGRSCDDLLVFAAVRPQPCAVASALSQACCLKPSASDHRRLKT